MSWSDKLWQVARQSLPEEMTESSELHGALHAAVGSLPPKFRAIVQVMHPQ